MPTRVGCALVPSMPRAAQKRRGDVIDLTGDADQLGSQAKRPALAASQPSQLNSSTSGDSGVYITPPLGSPSAPAVWPANSGSRSSHLTQPSPSSQAGIQEPVYLDLTQDDDSPPTELYGSYDSKIVGVRYYSGYASPGEVVLCHREPQNQYDRNAIRVDNVMHQQIGYLPRAVVEKIAPYVDSGDITLEAQLTGEKGMVDCPIRLFFYGPSQPTERGRIEKALKADKFVKATQLEQTRKEAEALRVALDLKGGRSTHGNG
ncbi:hypothetical protein HIM_11908 [Hirsutella minnesotensis 3608]|uniref:HIRAN domain-containing protein n=1 Tax=Hirsutella minnesotensis 3608 TaxID=1043627 RepID=A0A0F8A0N7_9HYPO|nr:hypothetical protein HIM_11908 [Hirsutella minnesotensis 3608]